VFLFNFFLFFLFLVSFRDLLLFTILPFHLFQSHSINTYIFNVVSILFICLFCFIYTKNQEMLLKLVSRKNSCSSMVQDIVSLLPNHANKQNLHLMDLVLTRKMMKWFVSNHSSFFFSFSLFFIFFFILFCYWAT